MLAILGYPCIYLLLSPTFGHPFGQDAMRPSASPVLLAPAESTHPHLPTAGGPHRGSWRHTRCCRKDSRPCCWSQHVSADVADKCHLTNPVELEKGCHMMAPSNNHYTCPFCWIGYIEHHWTVRLILTVSHPNYELSSHKGCCWCPTQFPCFTFHRKPVDLVAFHTQNLPVTLPKPLRRSVGIANIDY